MQNSQNVFEQLDIFNDYFKEIIEESMYDKLKEVCNIPNDEQIIVADIQYLPVFHRMNGSKILKRLMLKHSNKPKFQNITVDDLEESGASWVEFIIYLKDCGATLVNPRDLY
tara:strand:- start:76 stop:411 length:336 start_codon:yes stop_codon:yes gene_type:complete